MKEIAINITLNVSHVVEMLAAIIIGLAVLLVVWNYIGNLLKHTNRLSNEQIRIQFGSAVAVALELLLGADVLTTAVAPNWDDIGELAAIAVIRTALNYFLGKELKRIKKMD
jgi:uncharacterized membrane protein